MWRECKKKNLQKESLFSYALWVIMFCFFIHQVQQVQEDSAKLQAAYAGDKAREITNREAEVVSAWLNLQGMCEDRRIKLSDTGDLFKFFNMVRTLILWMDDVIRQMNTTEKPR